MVSKKASALSSKSASSSSANNKRSSLQNSTKTSNHNKIGGKSVKKVQVSQSAQKELASLLDELRSSLASGEGEELQKQQQQQQQPIHFDVGDKRMVKKIVSLVSSFVMSIHVYFMVVKNVSIGTFESCLLSLYKTSTNEVIYESNLT